MRFKLLLEAPSALGAESRTKQSTPKTQPTGALGAASRSKSGPKLYDTKDGSKEGTSNNKPSENFESIFRDSNQPQDVRELALVKWLNQYYSGNPLTRFLSAGIDIESLDDIPEMISGSFEERTQQSAAESKFRKIVKETQAKRENVRQIFNAILISVNKDNGVFEKILLKLDINRLPKEYYSNVEGLAYTIANDPKIDKNNDYLLNLSLYNRSPKEFNYTLKIMDIVHNPSKLSKYFDPETIDIEELFNDSGDIKEAGIIEKDSNDLTTIYGTLENWKSFSSPAKNENPSENNSSKIPTFKSFEDAKKAGEDSINNVIRINGNFKFDPAKKDWVPVDA